MLWVRRIDLTDPLSFPVLCSLIITGASKVPGSHELDQRLANSGLPSVCVCVCVCVSYGLRIVFLFYNSEKMERRLFCGMGK